MWSVANALCTWLALGRCSWHIAPPALRVFGWTNTFSNPPRDAEPPRHLGEPRDTGTALCDCFGSGSRRADTGSKGGAFEVCIINNLFLLCCPQPHTFVVPRTCHSFQSFVPVAQYRHSLLSTILLISFSVLPYASQKIATMLFATFLTVALAVFAEAATLHSCAVSGDIDYTTTNMLLTSMCTGNLCRKGYRINRMSVQRQPLYLCLSSLYANCTRMYRSGLRRKSTTV